MHTRIGNTAVINYQKNSISNPLSGIEIGFEEDILLDYYQEIRQICEYWLSNKAITEEGKGNFVIVNSNTIQLLANFNGYFDGNLMDHHDSVSYSKKDFSIRLLKLFICGITPETRKGKKINGIFASPVYLRFIYLKELDNFTIQEKLERIKKIVE